MAGPAKNKRPIEKLTGSPYTRLIEFMQEHHMETFRVVLRRRGKDGSIKVIKSYNELPPEEIDRMVDWVPQEYGGGRYEVEVTHPQDPSSRYFNWGFEVEGDPIIPKRKGSTPDDSQQSAWWAQSQVPPGAVAPPMPTVGGYPGGPRMGFQGGPMGMNQPFAPRSAPSTSAKDAKLEAELEKMREQNRRLEQQMLDQRHQSEMQKLQDTMAAQLRELQMNNEKQIEKLMSRLEKKGESGGEMKAMFEMVMANSKMQQDAQVALMQRENNERKDSMKMMEMQMQRDMDFRKEMFALAQQSNDPSKTAALLDLMGSQTASQLNLIQQVVQSGLLGGEEPEPHWLKAIKTTTESLGNFGQRFIEQQQHKQQMEAYRAQNQQMAGAPGQQMRQQVRQGLPSGQPQGQPQQGPRPGTGPGFGQPVGKQPTPPQPQPPAPPQPSNVIQMPQPSQQQEAAHAPSLTRPLMEIGNAVMAGADPETVGEMVFTHCDYLRYWNMLPPEWAQVFTEPVETLRLFADTYLPQADVSDEYIEAVAARMMEVEASIDNDEEDEEEDIIEAEGIETPAEGDLDDEPGDSRVEDEPTSNLATPEVQEEPPADSPEA